MVSVAVVDGNVDAPVAPRAWIMRRGGHCEVAGVDRLALDDAHAVDPRGTAGGAEVIRAGAVVADLKDRGASEQGLALRRGCDQRPISDQVEIVDREPGIAPDRRALEAGIGAVGVALEDDVRVVIGEEELRTVLARDPPDRRKARRLRIEMRPHGGGEDLGHGSREGLEGEGRWAAGPTSMISPS